MPCCSQVPLAEPTPWGRDWSQESGCYIGSLEPRPCREFYPWALGSMSSVSSKHSQRERVRSWIWADAGCSPIHGTRSLEL